MKDTHYRFRKLEFWADSGMICVVDERFSFGHEKSFKALTCRDFLLRLNSFSEELKKHKIKYADERQEYIKLCEDGVACVRQAKKQGDPADPKTMSEMLRHRRRNWVLCDNTGSGTSTYAGSADSMPENSLLPPIPNHPEVEASRIIVP
jgi:hypothetical protein